MDHAPDFIECKTGELLARAKRSPYFTDIIADAEDLERRFALVWDICLAISVSYWCDPLPH